MSTVVFIDGRSVKPDEASVSIFDRGFLYGDSVFETVRTYDGRPFALGEHLARLERSAERVLISMPVTRDTLAREVQAAVTEAGNPESYVRIIVTRGSGPLGLDLGFEVNPLRVVIVASLSPPSADAYDKGIAVVTYRTHRVTEATEAAGAKVGNYLVAVLATQHAAAQGAGEALIVDADGHVVEGATSNVFAVVGSSLVTPPEEAGILAGITRARVLEVARELGLPIELRPLGVDELRGANEAFISSSIRELLPVVRLDGQPLGDGAPGPVTRRLLAGFRDKVRNIMDLAE
jgi:branched-chain amino acid aminotransferase